MSNAKRTPGRICDVMAALRAREVAADFNKQGLPFYAKQARELVRIHLRRAAIAKAKGAAA